jgi:hypothetical protein|tara:strand:- start:333 stop:491 length:159 start_codon:yes stop_codon:yes gene_type:complete
MWCVLVLVNKSARVFFDVRKTNWRFRYEIFLLGKNKNNSQKEALLTLSKNHT